MTLPSCSGLGAEEPLSSMTEDISSPLSTSYNTHSSSEEMVTEPRASLHGSRELPAGGRTRMRTASELLLDRCAGRGVRRAGRWAQACLVAAEALSLVPPQVPAHPGAGGG